MKFYHSEQIDEYIVDLSTNFKFAFGEDVSIVTVFKDFERYKFVEITKDEFVLKNIVLLQKTGLINLFKDTETVLKGELSRLQNIIGKQKKDIKRLTNNKNYYKEQVNTLSECKEKAEQLERVLEKAQSNLHQLGIELECQTENKRIVSKLESILIEKDKEQFRMRLELEGQIKSLESVLKFYFSK